MCLSRESDMGLALSRRFWKTIAILELRAVHNSFKQIIYVDRLHPCTSFLTRGREGGGTEISIENRWPQAIKRDFLPFALSLSLRSLEENEMLQHSTLHVGKRKKRKENSDKKCTRGFLFVSLLAGRRISIQRSIILWSWFSIERTNGRWTCNPKLFEGLEFMANVHDMGFMFGSLAV